MNQLMNKFIASARKITVLFFSLLSVLHVTAAEENITTNLQAQKVNTVKTPLVIESQVKGSQEQPNVIYIMPWQGINNPILIEGHNQKIITPNFKPINPKIFKQQAEHFYNLNVKNKKTIVNK